MLDLSCHANRVRVISHPFRDSAGVVEPLPLAGTVQVDPREEHGQLRRLRFDTAGTGGVGQLERAGLEPLVPDGQAVAVEIKDLEAIAATVDEEEEMAGQGVLCEAFLDQAAECVEALAHVGGPGAKEDPDGRGGQDHGVSSEHGDGASAATSRPSHVGSGGASKRSRTWWGNSISTAAVGTWPTGCEWGSSSSGTNRGGSGRVGNARVVSRRFQA